MGNSSSFCRSSSSCAKQLHVLPRFCVQSNQNVGILVFVYKFGMEFVRIAMRIIGPLLILAAVSLIMFVLFVYLTKMLPMLARDSVVWYWIHLLFGLFLVFNILFNYAFCALTPAGTPEVCEDPAKYFGRIVVNTNDGKPVYLERTRLDLCPGVAYRYCGTCKAIKPPRAHHCGVSGRCILEMDHYCPWMGNCVGFLNYRYFFLFLFYLSSGAIYVILIFLSPYIVLKPINAPDSGEDFDLVFSFILAISALAASGCLLLWHVYLVLTNQTTIEFYINMGHRQDAKEQGEVYRNPFDQGWRKNLRRVFGDVPCYAALLTSRRRPPEPLYPLLPDPLTARVAGFAGGGGHGYGHGHGQGHISGGGGGGVSSGVSSGISSGVSVGGGAGVGLVGHDRRTRTIRSNSS